MTLGYRLALAALVFFSVAFVHLTAAVGLVWLVPLYVLTLAAPALARLQNSGLYRALWNLAVMVIFAILVHDAYSSGVRHLLEDGLILAAFCQVHLLNVLRREQKTDLLFFNSFLIALVTSFFCQDLVYSLVFVGYACLFITVLQMSTVASADHALHPALIRAIVRDSLPRTALVLVLSGGLFLVWPRDFHREGLVGDSFGLDRITAEVGFVDEVRLGRSARVTLSNRVVLQLELLEGTPSTVPSHWRGATLSFFDRDGWRGHPVAQGFFSVALDPRWTLHGGRGWTRAQDAAPTMVRVRCSESQDDHLFAPLRTQALAVEPPGQPERITPLSDGTLRYASREGSGRGRSLSYRATFAASGPTPPRLSARHRSKLAAYLWIDSRHVPEVAFDIAREVVASLPEGADQRALVEALRAHLAAGFGYALPGESGAARDLADFMSGQAGGHCEYFATALGVLLRLRSVPCRLVTGYLAEEWDEAERILTVRAKHAHAWIEVWDDQVGWYTVDPSPTRAATGAVAVSWIGRARAWIEGWWQVVAAFDSTDRDRAMAWLADLPARIAVFASRHWAWTGLGLVAVTLGLWWRRRGRRLPPPIAVYLAVVRRLGLELAPCETPRELLRRATDRGVDSDRIATLTAATETHEMARFGD